MGVIISMKECMTCSEIENTKPCVAFSSFNVAFVCETCCKRCASRKDFLSFGKQCFNPVWRQKGLEGVS